MHAWFWHWPGKQLRQSSRIGCCWTYEVVLASSDKVIVKDERGEYPFALEDVSEYFRLSFARTYYAAQGLTFERVRLWDVDHQYFTRSHLITGLSRCTSAAAVDFGSYKESW